VGQYIDRCTSIRINSLSPAPPLTLNNVLDVVKNVQSWRTLGQHIYSSYSYKLDAVQDKYVSDEARLKAVIEDFLSGRARPCQQPSWRALIWCLYEANEIQLAENIRSFAEPVQGRYGKVHDVTVEGTIMNMVLALLGYGRTVL
jgi:hypothetical protein